MKKIIKVISALALASCVSSSLYAGFAATTSHSRANCGTFNESITWHYLEPHWWKVISIHESARYNHQVNTGLNYTWRAAAYHFNEATDVANNPWYVKGMHFYANCQYCTVVYDYYTDAGDCKIYDGWWDKSG